jgi:HK97 family phage portal protein
MKGGDKLEFRNLFSKMFGSKKPAEGKRFELVNTKSSYFHTWTGNMFDSDIVRSAVRPIANTIGKLSAKHIQGTDKIKMYPSPWIKQILENPNPYMSMQDFLTKMIFQRELNYNAFAYAKKGEDGYIQELYPIPFSSVELLDIGGTVSVKFRFRTGDFMTVPYIDLIHLRKDFYSNDFYGDSGNICTKNIMEVINTTDQGIVNAVKNSALIKWIMKFNSVLRPEDRQLQIDDFIKNYLAISNKGGVAASDGRYELEQVKDNNFLPNVLQTKETVQRLFSFFGVNEAIVQNKYTEDQWNAFYESVIEPIIIQLSNAFTNIFFSAREKGFGNKIIFETSNLAYASMSTKLGLVAMVDRGAMTPNEWRKVLNLESIEGGDKPIRRLDTAEVGNGKEKDKGVDNLDTVDKSKGD